MSKVVENIAIGAALIGVSLFVPGGFLVAGSLLTGVGGLATTLAVAGAGLVLSGVGTLLGQKASGIHTTSRNPIAPWQVIYGRKLVGGTVVYQEEVADNNRILLMVVAVAAHPCQAIEQVWFNNKRLPFYTNTQFSDQANPGGFLESYTFGQFHLAIETISRVNDIVSVTYSQDPIGVWANNSGQTVQIKNTVDAAGGSTFEGYYPIVETGPNSFTYTCGGPQGAGRTGTGEVITTYPDYGQSVTVGYYLGDQTEASGIIMGNTAGYWTPDCILKGRTYVALKLTYNPDHYSGLPEISFVVRGKNDIFDPRTGTTGYTNNAALCIADYLAQPKWGFGAAYHTQIPDAQLIAAANICDEQVLLASGGAESRYCCDGAFDVSVSRGEVLQNLLTSCGGRLVYIGGQFMIYPAAWITPSGAVTIGDGSTGPQMMMNDAGLVAQNFNNPVLSYVPDCAGSTESQFVYAIGLLNAFQAVGNPNAKALAGLILSAIEPYLFRGVPVPDQVTEKNPWSPDSYFAVKQAFLGYDGTPIGVNQDFASTLQGTWRALVGGEIQTSCDSYNWAIRLFTLAALIFDGASETAPGDPGYGLSQYGASYGDPNTSSVTINSGWLTMLAAIKQMARIIYQVAISPYAGAAVPFLADFSGTPLALSSLQGPLYVGYQSPWAISQVNPASVAGAVQFLADSQAAMATMGTIGDSIVVAIAGPNAESIEVPIQIDSNGNSTTTFSYAGRRVGVDTITAVLASHSLTSNAAEIAWDIYQAPLAFFGVTFQVMTADNSGLFNGLSTPMGGAVSVAGMMFNSHPFGEFPGDPHQSGNQANPFTNNIVTTTGSYGGDLPIPNTGGRFNAVILGNLSVQTAGNQTFTVLVNSAFVIGFNNGATLISGSNQLGALASGTAQMKYPSLAGLNTAGDYPGGNWAVVTFTINFPSPAIYQYEVDYVSGLYAERQFMLMTGAGGIIPNVGIITGAGGATATGAAPSGQLKLTPYSGGYPLGTSATFTLSMTGLTYTTPIAGPFTPVYQQAITAGQQTWGTVGTFGYFGPDPNYEAGYYQYRPLAELCDLLAGAVGSEAWHAQAVSIVATMIAWLAAKWTVAAAGPPNIFGSSGALVTSTPDTHCAGLILYSVLTLDLAARPMGGGESTMYASQLALLNLVYGLFEATYQTTGAMAGTFCVDPTGNRTWSPVWSGEILRALSKLVTWGNLNGQPAMVAQATIWIDGLVNFGLNNIQVVDPDLGYTVNDLRGAVTWRPNLARTDLFNAIKGTYISEANNWQQSDFPTYAQDQLHGYTNGTAAHNLDANWDADGQRLVKDVQLPFTSSCPTAQRLAKIELMRIRQQGHGLLVTMMGTYRSAPLDTIFFSYVPFGWTNKILEVANVRLVPFKVQAGSGKEIPALGAELDIRESAASVYEWDPTEELSVQGYSYIPGLQNLSPD